MITLISVVAYGLMALMFGALMWLVWNWLVETLALYPPFLEDDKLDRFGVVLRTVVVSLVFVWVIATLLFVNPLSLEVKALIITVVVSSITYLILDKYAIGSIDEPGDGKLWFIVVHVAVSVVAAVASYVIMIGLMY